MVTLLAVLTLSRKKKNFFLKFIFDVFLAEKNITEIMLEIWDLSKEE